MENQSSNIENIISNLSSEEIIELSRKLEDKQQEAKEERAIRVFLQIEKILQDNEMDTKEFKDLNAIRIKVNGLRNRKYSDGNGNFWSGRGKRPQWVVDAVGNDGDLSPLAYEEEGVKPLNERNNSKKQTETTVKEESSHTEPY